MLNQSAPDFELEATNGDTVRLRDLAGKFVVLVFYPMNNTPVCNMQLEEMNLKLDDFMASKVLVFGVNTAAKDKHVNFCQRKGLGFPILSDPGAKVAQKYGAAMAWLPWMISRTVVAIDPRGIICFYQKGKPDPQLVLDAIQRKSSG